jgi:dihydrodipicolinate synthase/N-acetylneuraminate lyase
MQKAEPLQVDGIMLCSQYWFGDPVQENIAQDFEEMLTLNGFHSLPKNS